MSAYIQFTAVITAEKPLWLLLGSLIKGLIEWDTKNEWLLRMLMQEMDKQIIRDALDVDMSSVGRFVNNKGNRQLALLKMMREGSEG